MILFLSQWAQGPPRWCAPVLWNIQFSRLSTCFRMKIQSELFRKSTCVTIVLFACLGTDKSHSHLSGLKFWANSDSDSTTISRRKLIYFAAERKSVVIAEQAGASDRSPETPWSPCCREQESQLLLQSKHELWAATGQRAAAGLWSSSIDTKLLFSTVNDTSTLFM